MDADRFEHMSRSLLAASPFLEGARAALTRTVYRALVQRDPVSIDTVAATAGFPTNRAEELLAQGPDFFQSRGVAEQWAVTQSDIEILSLSRASELGRRLTSRMFGAAPEPVADAVTPFTIR